MFGHHSKTYYKYLASYGALLLTAIIALVFVSQVFFIRQLRTNLEDNHRALVQQSVQEMDSDLQQIYDIEYQISTVNQNFFSYYLEAPSPVRDLRLVNEFKNLLAPSTLISEIALADADAKMVYTSTAVYSAALFFDRIFSFPEGDPVASSLADSSRRIIRTAQRSGSAERYLAFINTPSVFSRLQNSVLIFFVQERHFLSFLSPESAPQPAGRDTGQQRAGRRIDDGTGCAADRRHQHHPPARHELPHLPRAVLRPELDVLLLPPRERDACAALPRTGDAGAVPAGGAGGGHAGHPLCDEGELPPDTGADRITGAVGCG